MKTPIGKTLDELTAGATRFSMPGHKGRLNPRDITEVDGADNLLCPTGSILESQQAFARDHGAAHGFFSVNGSSACVLAMMAYLGRGAKLIVCRDFHISAANGMALMGLEPIYVALEYGSGQIPGAPETERILAAMEEHGDAAAVFLTSPNYYGRCADLEVVSREAHRRGMLVLVDSAHGAHFPYSPLLPKGAGQAGADAWCVSCHKTLPSLNQSAALLCGERIDADRLKACLNLFQTTSPSYPILESIETGAALMRETGAEELERLASCIREFARKTAGRARLCPTDDFTRLVLDVSPLGMTGFACAQALMEERIWPEAADERNVILISTIMDGQEDFDRLAQVLGNMPQGDGLPQSRPITLDAEAPGPVGGGGKPTSLAEAPGRRAARHVLAYPPGVPVMLAGQIYTGEKAEQIAHLRNTGYNLINVDADGRVWTEEA